MQRFILKIGRRQGILLFDAVIGAVVVLLLASPAIAVLILGGKLAW